MATPTLEESLNNIEIRIDAIEECYEYMLAYAAKGVSGQEGQGVSSELRHYLIGAVHALDGLAQAWSNAITAAELKPAVKFEAFLGILERDAADSLATIELVLAQPWISSLLIDNLNASLHLRALLTDLFLIDEIVKTQTRSAAKSAEELVSIEASDGAASN
jgi:hypothetical protein